MWRLVHQWSFLLFYIHLYSPKTVGICKLYSYTKIVLTVFWLFLTIFDDWYTVGTVLVDMWRLVHKWSFLLFWLSFDFFDCFWRLVHCWYTVGTVLVDMWRLVHQWSFLLFWLSFDCFWLYLTIGTLLVQWFWVFLTIGIVYESSKTVKRQSNSKKMTISVQIVTCLKRVRRIHKAAQTPLPRETSITCAWAVATARRPWAGLTICVYMDVHAPGSRSLPRAATLSSTYWWCLQLV